MGHDAKSAYTYDYFYRCNIDWILLIVTFPIRKNL